jgi:2-methylcitrate dehydratase PrpD
VTIRLADGRTFTERVAHPRGSPHRRMSWDELSALFRDTVSDALPAARLQEVLDLVAALDRGSNPRRMVAAFMAAPGWIDAGGD